MNDLTPEVKSIQEQILSLVNRIGYGTACNPKDSGECHALIHAFKNKVPGVVLDVGAYHGEFLEMAHALFPHNEYHCFEPDPVAYKKLLEMTNHIGGKIMYHNSALSNENGIAPLFSFGDDTGLSSLCKRDLRQYGEDFSREHQVVVRRLNTYMNLTLLTEIDYLKMDTEGTELFILQDSLNLIETGKIKHIQWEMGGCNIDSRTFFRDFYNMLNEKYNIYRILPKGLARVEAYTEMLEIFQTINFYAELKEIEKK